MKCKRCQAKAVIKITRHHTSFCKGCFFDYFQGQVQRAIDEWKMFTPRERILVAVSGGKDSLALWDVLLQMGYAVEGLHIDLGIGGYSTASRERCETFAQGRGLTLRTVGLKEEYDGGIPEIAEDSSRSPCSACGTIKRHLFNRLTVEEGYDVIATGHNLDDEASRLFGNLLRWQVDYLANQVPALPAHHPKLARKVKPLYRLAEREIAAYAVLRGIDYIVDECPMSAGAKQFLYKDILNRLESESPGTKQAFYWDFLREGRRIFKDRDDPASVAPRVALSECQICGQVTTGEVCSFCRLTGRAGKAANAVVPNAGEPGLP